MENCGGSLFVGPDEAQITNYHIFFIITNQFVTLVFVNMGCSRMLPHTHTHKARNIKLEATLKLFLLYRPSKFGENWN